MSNNIISRIAAQYLGTTIEAGRGAPGHATTATRLKQMGLVGVDEFYGQFRPHKRSTVSQGEMVQDESGAVYFLVGSDENGKPITAVSEHEFELAKKKLDQDRLRHETSYDKTAMEMHRMTNLPLNVERHVAPQLAKPVKDVDQALRHLSTAIASLPLKNTGEDRIEEVLGELVDGLVYDLRTELLDHLNKFYIWK